MKNDGCNRGTIHFVKALSQHIDPVVPIPTQDKSSDDFYYYMFCFKRI